jgi:hypothetical protein
MTAKRTNNAETRDGEFTTAQKIQVPPVGDAPQVTPEFCRLTESNKKATAEMPRFTDEKDLLKKISVCTEALLAERQDAPLTLRRAPKIRSRRRRAELIAPSCPL